MSKSNLRGGGMKEVLCAVCKRPLKRRKYRKAGVGPACLKKLQNGTTGIQMEAFKEFNTEEWNQKVNG